MIPRIPLLSALLASTRRHNSNRIPLHVVDEPPHRVRLTNGLFRLWRRVIGWPLLALFFITPWLSWQGKPAVFFDLNAQQFHIGGWLLWSEDLLLLSGLLIGGAFALFFVSMYAGRLWCGFSCPQTVWTFMFIWLEEQIEGSRQMRRKLDQGKGTRQQKVRRALKFVVWGLLSLATAITMIAYFYPLAQWWADVIQGDISSVATFWLILISTLTFLNAGWLRESVCTHMCPYSRFQSVMFDNQTRTVRYDTGRGEPRGKHNPDNTSAGDCIDCGLCVQVCPTNIDIRDGLQIACIDCGACIDACDKVMRQIGRATGLITYQPEQQLSPLQRWRLWGYGVLAATAFIVVTLNTLLQPPLHASLERDRLTLYQLTPDDTLINRYTLKLHNRSHRDMQLTVYDQQHAVLHTTLSAGQRAAHSLDIERTTDTPAQTLALRIEDQHTGYQQELPLHFINPAVRGARIAARE
ncbi:MAG: cytochrome c oxidase accessory protein CcoG [Saccharospirillaceae bacterium]|nr:cytochrome c oxidase accessory protein CcoG [Saccharospirillaceae bacterium]MCD8532394.1 cytochrome c oxidase accessory protein CcoG [Saccharospirillaceae bacterium]